MAKTTRVLVDTKSVKVVFNKAGKEFTEVMTSFYLALGEMNDKKLLYAKNLRAAMSWLETLEECNKDGKKDKAIEVQKSEIEKLQKAQSALMEEINSRINKCYALIPTDLYSKYTGGDFKKGIEEFFKANNIEPTPTLTAFMDKAFGLKCANAKTMFKNGKVLDYQGKNQFNKLFMSCLAQLMLDKNALKPDMYK